MYTRTQYIGKEVSSEAYYGQFVTKAIVQEVETFIGRKRITESQDPYFNDIPLDDWDVIANEASNFIDTHLWRKAHNWEDPRTYPWSLSDGVCIAKAAARIIRGDKRAMAVVT